MSSECGETPSPWARANSRAGASIEYEYNGLNISHRHSPWRPLHFEGSSNSRCNFILRCSYHQCVSPLDWGCTGMHWTGTSLLLYLRDIAHFTDVTLYRRMDTQFIKSTFMKLQLNTLWKWLLFARDFYLLRNMKYFPLKTFPFESKRVWLPVITEQLTSQVVFVYISILSTPLGGSNLSVWDF